MRRECTSCGAEKPEGEYMNSRGNPDLKTCKTCRNRKNRNRAPIEGITKTRASEKRHHDAEEIMGGSRRGLEMLRVRL